MKSFLLTKQTMDFIKLIKSFILWPCLIWLCCTPLLTFGVKSQGPFFWQIQKDNKSSYVLGTMHGGVDFEELQCHNEIKDYLLAADFLLTEALRFKIKGPQMSLIKQTIYDNILANREDNFVDSLNDDTKKLLQEILPERYYIKYGENPLESKSSVRRVSIDKKNTTEMLGEARVEDPTVLEEKKQSFEEAINQLIYFDLLQILRSACTIITNQYRQELANKVSREPKPTLNNSVNKDIINPSINFQNIFQVDFVETIPNRSFYKGKLDYQILIDFLNYKQSFIQNPKLMDDNSLVSQFLSPIEDQEIVNLITQILSSGIDLISYIDQIAASREDIKNLIEQFPKSLDNRTTLVNQFVSPLDDLAILLAIPVVRVLTPQREDIEEWVKNFDERCSKDWVIKLKELDRQSDYKELDRQSDYKELDRLREQSLTTGEKQKRDFISGVMNLENDAKNKKTYDDHRLDAENNYFRIKYIMNFRNEIWRPKIIKAHENHNSIFIAAGLAHFITQDHNPNNIRALKDYIEVNKSLPVNVLDMLKEEGFTVKRMKPDCHFE